MCFICRRRKREIIQDYLQGLKMCNIYNVEPNIIIGFAKNKAVALLHRLTFVLIFLSLTIVFLMLKCTHKLQGIYTALGINGRTI